MRMLARHHQQFTRTPVTSNLSHPRAFASRYSDTQRRLDIRELPIPESQGAGFAQPRLKIKLNSENGSSFFQLANTPAVSLRSQLPAVVRNSGLRLRVTTQLLRYHTPPAGAVSTKEAATRGKHLLLTQKTARLARRVHARRLRLRLPRVTVRRREVRRNSVKLFTRHTLKQPVTLRGNQALLLPVTNAYKLRMMPTTPSPLITSVDLRITRQLDAHNPRV